MKNDSKSALSIKQLVIIIPLMLVLVTLIQLFGLGDMALGLATEVSAEEVKIAKEKSIEVENIEKEVVYERKVATTSRYQVARKIKVQEDQEEEVVVEEPKITYKSIDEIEISRDMDLTVRTGISKEDFKVLLSGVSADRTKFFYDNSDLIYDLCEKYELNEVFLCGLIAGESGWNISSWHRSKCNYISMMSRGSLIQFSSVEEGLEAAAKLLHNHYLTEGGAYYRGKTLSSVQRIFCPNSSTWVGLIYGCMRQIVK